MGNGNAPSHMDDGTRSIAVLDTEDAAAESMLAFQNLERHRKERKRKRLIRIGIGAAALALIGAFLLPRFFGNNGSSEEPTIATGFVYRGDFADTVSSSGSTQPLDTVVVVPEIDGIIDSVFVEEGQHVNEGDMLLTIRNDDLDKAVRNAELAVRSAQNNVNSAKSNLEQLTGPNGRGAGDDDLPSETVQIPEQAQVPAAPTAEEIEAARIALESANIELESAQEALEDARERAAKREVRAPKSGTIVQMNATPGAQIGAGAASGTGTLVQIADLSQMKVRVQINEIDISKIVVGQKATVTFAALDGVMLEGEVVRIAAVSEGSGEMGYSGGIVTYAVDILIPTPDPNLKPGMTASVDIACNAVSDTIIVPTTAIMEDESGFYVTRVTYNASDEPLRERVSITVVARGATEAAVAGQLEEGDMVELGGWYGGDDDFEMAVYG